MKLPKSITNNASFCKFKDRQGVSGRIHEIQMQGSVSQILDLGPSFDCIKRRKLNIKKMTKSYPFFYIK